MVIITIERRREARPADLFLFTLYEYVEVGMAHIRARYRYHGYDIRQIQQKVYSNDIDDVILPLLIL